MLSLLTAFVLLGFAATLAQIFVLREYLVDFYGNELSLGLILALWLLGHSLGSFLAAYYRVSDERALGLLLLLLSLAPLLFLPLSLLLTWLFLPSLGQLVPLATILLAALALVMPIGAVMGLPFPNMCELFSSSFPEGRESAIARFYVSDAIGSMMGGALHTFVFVNFASPLEIACICSGAILFARFLILGARRGLSQRRSATLGLMICILLIFVFGDSLQFKLSRARFDLSHSHLDFLSEEDTPYQHLTLAEASGQYSLFSDGRYRFSFPDLQHTALEAHLSLLLHRDPEEVLLLGGGVNGFAYEALKHGIDELTYVELDGGELEFLLPYLPEVDRQALSSDRLRLERRDGRRYLSSLSDDSLDLLILRLPEAQNAMLNRFYTLEFFDSVSKKLREDGVFLCSVSASANYLGEELSAYLATVLSTLRAVFPVVEVIPGQRCLFVSGKAESSITLDHRALGERFRERSCQTEYFSPLHVKLCIDEYRVSEFRKRKEELSRGALNRDSSPLAYFHNLVLWDIFSGSGLSSFLAWLRQLSSVDVLEVVLLLLFLAFSSTLILSSGKRRAGLCILYFMSITGGSAMIFHVQLLLVYQNLFGSIYSKLGFVVGTFMGGLSIGGLIGKKLLKESYNPSCSILLSKLLMLALLLSLPSIIESRPSQFPLFLLVFVGGLLPGLEYPLAASLLLRRGFAAGSAGGLVHGADVLGGAAGAILS